MNNPIMDHSTPTHTRDLRALPHTHQRSKFIDYKGRGIYLITLCTEGRRPLLGELCGDSPEGTYVRPSALGYAVLRCWRDIPAIQRGIAAQRSLRLGSTCTRDIQLLSWQLMPDHFHGIIFVRKDMDIALGRVIRGFMMGCTQAYHELIKSVSIPTAQQYGPQVGIRTDPLSSIFQPLWEKGFHDRPLSGNGQLQHMIDYVKNNPRRLWMRRHSAQFFRLHKGVRIGARVFAAKGELALLGRPIHVVHVRRRFSEEERRDYMNRCIIAARQGKVLIGAFISEYEQQVRTVALAEGHTVIQLTTDVLTEYYKPYGLLFDACSNGQLLLLSQREGECGYSRRITREECNELNKIAEEIGNEEKCRIIPHAGIVL